MSPRTSKWFLWLLFVCVAPVPYTLGGVEVAPIGRLAFFTSLTVTAHISEGSGGSNWWAFIAMGTVQTLLYTLAFYFLAAIGSRLLLSRLTPGVRGGIVAVAGVLALIVFSSFPFYDTPMSSSGLYSTLLEVLR